MCGKYFITREEEEKGWQEIIAILQRRGEPFKTSKIFPAAQFRSLPTTVVCAHALLHVLELPSVQQQASH